MKCAKLIKFLSLFAIIIIVFCAIKIIQGEDIFSQKLNQVREVKIEYFGSDGHLNISLTAKRDQYYISKLYNSIASTKSKTFRNPRETGRQESDSVFSITFYYNNGSFDKIESTETGHFVYRRLNSSGWTGGRNENVLEIIDDIHKRINSDGVIKK